MEWVSYLDQVELTVPFAAAFDKFVPVALHCTVVYPRCLFCRSDCNRPRILVVLYCTQPQVEIDGPRALHLADTMILLVWSHQLSLYLLHNAKQHIKTVLPTTPSSLYVVYILCLLPENIMEGCLLFPFMTHPYKLLYQRFSGLS